MGHKKNEEKKKLDLSKMALYFWWPITMQVLSAFIGLLMKTCLWANLYACAVVHHCAIKLQWKGILDLEKKRSDSIIYSKSEVSKIVPFSKSVAKFLIVFGGYNTFCLLSFESMYMTKLVVPSYQISILIFVCTLLKAFLMTFFCWIKGKLKN